MCSKSETQCCLNQGCFTNRYIQPERGGRASTATSELTVTFRKVDGTKSDVDKTGFPPKPVGTGSQLTVKSDLVFPATSERQTKNPRADNESKREIAELLLLHASSSSSSWLVIL